MARSWTEKQKKEAAERMRKAWVKRRRMAKASTKPVKRSTGKVKPLKPGAYIIGNVLLTVSGK